ncbi:hypothetical protein PInf_004734 [Phytophthora infestans]|nr:hypothetical protein PInf_004734 [Phytophthora infestans]
MGLQLMCVAGGALALLLILLTAATVRLAVMLVQLVTPRYTLAICAVALACWFVDSRRRRYARGFYSCSRVPQIEQTQEHTQPDEEEEDGEEDEKRYKQEDQSPVTAVVAPMARETLESLQVELRKVATAPPSETESEDDDSESEDLAELLRLSRSMNADVKERKHRVPRRRADTGMTGSTKHNERSRRATFTSKQDAHGTSSRSGSDMLEDALRSDGYWIGDFRVQRRLVSRRSHANSPKAN